MKTRRVFTQDEVIELVDPLGNSVLKAHVTRGARGNLQVLVYSQPGARVHLDPPQSALPIILSEDWLPEE
jgi:hypothetical protein